MLFLIKYTLRSILLLTLLIFLYEIALANQQLLNIDLTQPTLDTLKTFFRNSNDALSYTIELIH